MSHAAVATPQPTPVPYERRRREQSLLYQLVQEHVETFFARTEAATGRPLPDFVNAEFTAFLDCGVMATRNSGCGFPTRSTRQTT